MNNKVKTIAVNQLSYKSSLSIKWIDWRRLLARFSFMSC